MEATRTFGDPRFDLSEHDGAFIAVGDGGEHALIPLADIELRLDVITGTLRAGPVALAIRVARFDQLEFRMHMVRQLVALLTGTPSPRPFADPRLARLVAALRADDGVIAGASLRQVAAALLGESRIAGEWPGEGEYIKSYIRRLATLGGRMRKAGPSAVLRREI